MSSARRIGTSLLACVFAAASAMAATSAQVDRSSFAQAASRAAATLLGVLYAGDGRWHECDAPACPTTDNDWGADSATAALYLRWRTTHDRRVRPVMSALLRTLPRYPAPCDGPADCGYWSDTPAWDAVTAMRIYAVLNDPAALARARAAYAFAAQSRVFRNGACPGIPYELPDAGLHGTKTLETTANVIKAALLLYGATYDRRYLQSAIGRYAVARAYYLDDASALYTVHVVDDGLHCRQVPRHFFASVNGAMIANGMLLWHFTGRTAYYDQAVLTARAVDDDLSDQRGVFADTGGDNDVAEPLVEAMYGLASDEGLVFARDWIERNAAAALSARAPDGTFGRYFDGPAPHVASIWASSGGLALEIAAGALGRRDTATFAAWGAVAPATAPITTLPATITFQGSGIALTGTMGRRCQRSHVRVLVDGRPPFDRSGLWENVTMPRGSAPKLLFAWRWDQPGTHTIVLEPGSFGGSVHILRIVAP